MPHLWQSRSHCERVPDKDKAGRSSAKPALMTQSGASMAIVPYRNRTFLGVVTDEEGYQQPRRPKPKGVTFGELPVTHREADQRSRKTSNVAPLIDHDDDDEYDMSYPPLSSSSAHDASTSSSSSSRDILVSHPSHKMSNPNPANSGQTPLSQAPP